MTPAVQPPSPPRTLTARRIGLAAVALVAIAGLIVAGKQLRRAQSESGKVEQAEQAYRQGVRLLREPDKRDALSAFDAAMHHPDLSKQARTMKATALIWMGRDAEGFTTFVEDPSQIRSAYNPSPFTLGQDKDSILRHKIKILEAAVATEPMIKELWVFKGDVTAQLFQIQGKTAKDKGALLDSIRMCYQKAQEIDPSYELARGRLSQRWLKPQSSPVGSNK